MNTSWDVLDVNSSTFYVCDDWKHGCIKNDGHDIVTMATGQRI